MKKSFLPLLTAFALSTAMLLGVAACDKQGNATVTPTNVKLTPANVAKLQKGMTRSQVVALFGEPTSVGDQKDFMVFKKQTVTYTEGKESLSVTYKNDEVEEYNSTVGTTKRPRPATVRPRRRQPPRAPSPPTSLPRRPLPWIFPPNGTEDRRGDHALPRFEAERGVAAPAPVQEHFGLSARRRPIGSLASWNFSPSTFLNW